MLAFKEIQFKKIETLFLRISPMEHFISWTNRSFNWNILVLSTAALCSVAGAKNINSKPHSPAITQNPATTLPETPQELWTRILTLLKRNGGFTNHQEVEEIIGLKFTKIEKDDEKLVPRLGAPYFYSMEEEVPGLELVKMGLFENTKEISFGLGWGPEIYERPNCLSLSQVVSDIDALGWAPAEVRPNQPGRNIWNFYTREAMAESARTGKPLMTYAGTSSLTIFMPNQLSQCVNGFGVHIWRP